MTTTNRYGFTLDGKALRTVETEAGDLIVHGYAAVWQGLDRQNENFLRGAFQRGIKSFLEGQAALCFHHQFDKGIGTVIDLREDAKGLFLRARVDYQPESSPLRYIWNGVKRGTYKGLSVGGFFKRKLTEKGWHIADVDLTEVSVTPVPVHPGTSLAVVAGKAMGATPLDGSDSLTRARRDAALAESAARQLDLIGLHLDVMALRARART